MSEEFDSVLTDDIGLVAYLKVRGHTTTEVQITEGVCRWRFSSAAVEDAADFMEDRALVNPKRYTQKFGATKKEMFALQARNTQ